MTSQVKEAVENARTFHPEPPRPLRRELPAPEPFPVEMLGPVLAPAAIAINEIVQAPVAICAQACLAAATLAAQALTNVLLPFGQVRPLSGFFVSVAASGERKTSADTFALEPINSFEEQLRADHRVATVNHQNSMDVWTVERKRITGDRELNPASMSKALFDLGLEPTPPIDPLVTCPEPTFEGLARLFASGRPSLGLFSSEGGQFLGGFGMGAEHRLKTSAGLSQLWDGQPLRRVRAGEGSRVLPNRRLSVHLMLQPTVSTQLLADPMLKDQGLLSRMLVSAPDSLMGTRFWREPAGDSQSLLNRYSQRLLEMLRTPLSIKPGTSNELELPAIDFEPSAKALWLAFSDHIESGLGNGAELEGVRFFAAKSAEHAARLAGVLTLVEDPLAVTISAANMEASISLAEHYLSEWQRLSDSASARPEIIEAERLLAWIGTWPLDVVGLPEIYQRGPNSIRDKKAAQAAVTLLEEHGWLIREPQGAYVGDTFRRDAWRIVRA